MNFAKPARQIRGASSDIGHSGGVGRSGVPDGYRQTLAFALKCPGRDHLRHPPALPAPSNSDTGQTICLAQAYEDEDSERRYSPMTLITSRFDRRPSNSQ
jgi:hypothetical protein